MFTHVMFGSNDLKKAKSFYDATFAALGGNPGEIDAGGRLVYTHDGGRFMVTTPINGEPATFANGGTIGILAETPEHVRAWHAAGAAHGGTVVETPPSERPNGAFVAYLRDPDGNKLCVRTRPTK